MRKWLICIALSLSICAAQTAANNAPDPESFGVYFYLDPSTHTLKELPREDFKKHNNASFFTHGTEVKLEGAASSFRIAEERPTFIFRQLPGESVAHYKLMQCAIHKDERRYQIGKWKGSTYEPLRSVITTISRYGRSSYKLTPDGPLMPGEYALLTRDKIFSFGIDASVK